MSLRITKTGFSSIMLDNDMQYLNYLFRVIEKLDKNAEVKINKIEDNCSISVLCSNVNIRKIMIQEIKEAHLIIGIDIEFSKSLKISNYISWTTI